MECISFSLRFVLLFFIFHSTSSSTTAGPLCHPDERSALLQLNSSLSVLDISQTHCFRVYLNETRMASTTSYWKENTNCCKWDGITCDNVTGHVIGLDLRCSGLKRAIHSNSSLFFLHHLQTLDLSYNDFSGSPVLPEFGKFKNLTHLDLSSSNFSGSVPLEVSHLSNLVSFILADDKLSIGVATFKALAQNLTHLRELSLSGINMSLVPPVSLMNLSSSLTSLELSYCQLQGKLPENNFQSYKLQRLVLRGNYLSGQIPWTFLNIVPLLWLDLSQNNFIGKIPEFYNKSAQKFSSHESSKYPLGSFPSNLRLLDLSSNSLNETMPSWIVSLPYLTYLLVSDNFLIGEIPKSHSTSLESLSLDRNKLHGTIPRSIFQHVHLKDLDLSSNNFMVNLELEELSKLKELKFLDLSSNNISWTFNRSINHAFDNLSTLGLSSCNLIEFPNFLKAFKRLEILDLSSNQIHGSVPKWLWELGKDSFTSLNLSNNFLTYMEPLPWNKLETLDLHSNFFVGPLPISSSPNLYYLFLSKNQFAGKIPTSFCNITSLSMLDVSYNNLSGTIPPCFGNLRSSLWVLDLRMNRFHGRVPPAFGKGCQLTTLNMNGNQLEGSLPWSLLNCQDLKVLDVGDNKINGSFPQWLESLAELQVLILKSNRFYGPIRNPKVRFPFQKLRIIDLSNNEFKGKLPTKYFENFGAMMDAHTDHLEYMETFVGYYQDSVVLEIKGFQLQLEKILTIFTSLDFSGNKFEGEIPRSIGKLRSLKGLNFSHNRLSGPIPPSLANLSNLEWLDLSSNELSGNIPLQLAADLYQLEKLNLSNNNLEGQIPSGRQFDTYDADSYTGNPGLCGSPLLKSCNGDKAQQHEGDDNGDEDVNNNGMIEWKVVMMGYGSGMVIGVSVGYMVLFRRGFDHWFSKRFGRGRPRHISIAPLRARR